MIVIDPFPPILIYTENNHWSNGANWKSIIDGVPPQNDGTHDVYITHRWVDILQPSVRGVTVDQPGVHIRGLVDNDGTSIDGFPLTIGAGGITASDSTLIFSGLEIFNDLILSADQQYFSSLLDLTLHGDVALQNHTLTLYEAGLGQLTIDGVISGTGGLLIVGGGDISFSQIHTYSGDTTINPGAVLRLDGTGMLSVATDVINNGAFVLNSGNRSFNSLSGAGTMSMAGGSLSFNSLNGTGQVSLASGLLTVGGGAFSGLIGGAGGLTKTSSATLTLNTAQSYTGQTTVSAGTLRLANTGSIANSSRVVVETNGTLDFAGAGASTIKGLAGSGTVLLGSGYTLTIGNTSGAETFDGLIQGTGAIFKAGASTQTFSNANTYTGGTTVSGGTLQLTNTTGSGIGTGPVLVEEGLLLLTQGGRAQPTLVDVTGQGTDVAELRVENIGSLLSTFSPIRIGGTGTSSLTVVNGGVVTTANDAQIGLASGTSGTATVTGAGSQFNVGLTLEVGLSGAATLTISDGGHVSSSEGRIGSAGFSDGTVIVEDAGSRWTSTGRLLLGRGVLSEGELIVREGGAVESPMVQVAVLDAAAVTIQDAGSSLVADQLFLGGSDMAQGGSGTMTVNSGGAVDVAGTLKIWQSGWLTIDGANVTAGTLDIGGALTFLDGTLTIDGGQFISPDASLQVDSPFADDHPKLVLTSSATVTKTGSLAAGSSGKGTIEIRDGSSMTDFLNTIIIGVTATGDGTILVDGADSALATTVDIQVGSSGSGVLTVSGGGSVTSNTGFLGTFGAASQGTATVDGVGSSWMMTGRLEVGRQGSGTLAITGGGSVTNTNGYIAPFAGSTGDATVSGAGSTWSNSGSLFVGDGGPATLSVLDNGTVEVGATLRIAAGGGVTLDGGNVVAATVDNSLGGSFSFFGGRLSTSVFLGNLVNQGGTLAPGNSPAVTTIMGDYTQLATGALEIEIGGTTPGSEHDRLVVSGVATLDGTLEVNLIGGFMPDLGDEFNVLAFASRSGDFASYTGLNVGGHVELRAEFTTDGLALVTRPAQDGDINLDGTVDIFDVNAVSAAWGTAGPAGDANGDGAVDIFDVNLISANWGATDAGGAAAVPEPTSWVLVLFGSIAFVGICRRKWSA